MARRAKQPDERKDGQIRVRAVVHDLLVGLEQRIRERTGDTMTQSDIVHMSLRILAKAIAPDLASTPSGVEFLASALLAAGDQPGEPSPEQQSPRPA